MHHKNTDELKGEGSREQLMTESKIMKKELQKKEKEQKEMTQVVEILKDLTKELVKQKEQLTLQMKEAERLMEENGNKVKSVEKEVTEKNGDITVNKAQGYLKLKEIITEGNWKLEERKKGHQELQLNTDNLMKRTMDEINKIEKQLEEIERQREEIQKKLESDGREEKERLH